MRTPRCLTVALLVAALAAVSTAPAQGLVRLPVGGLLGLAPAPAPTTGSLVLGGVPCRLLPPAVPTAAPVGTGTCPGVRPGGVVTSEVGSCTFNFLFVGAGGHRYMGTAGHCILPVEGEQSWPEGAGPEARDGAGARIGEFAFAVLGSEKDFALVRLDPAVEASPQMCHFGGPTGLNATSPTTPVVLQYFGNGLVIGDVLPARSAVALGMPDPDHVFAVGLALPGDSGAGVISADGGAVGVLVTLGVAIGTIGTTGVDAGTVGITRLGPQVARASEVLGTALQLQTAPLL